MELAKIIKRRLAKKSCKEPKNIFLSKKVMPMPETASGGKREVATATPGREAESLGRAQAKAAARPDAKATKRATIGVPILDVISELVLIADSGKFRNKVVTTDTKSTKKMEFVIMLAALLSDIDWVVTIAIPKLRMGVRSGATSIPPRTIMVLSVTKPQTVITVERTKSI